MTKYSVIVDDYLGNHLAYPRIINGGFFRTVNGLGSFKIEIPYEGSDEKWFRRNNLIEIWRIDDSGESRLATDTLWFLREIDYTDSIKSNRVTLAGYDLNYILSNPNGDSGRIVAFKAGTTQSHKDDFADDMIKEIATENFSQTAVDFNGTTRKTPFLLIDAQTGSAPNVVKGFSYRNIAKVYKEICQKSFAAGTYLAYDFVVTIPPNGLIPDPESPNWWPPASDRFTIVFKTFTGQRGKDHTRDSGSPVFFGPKFGNLDNAKLTKEYSNEINESYAGGQGIEQARNVQVVHGSGVHVDGWIWNKRETFVDYANLSTTDALLDECYASNEAGKPKMILSGDIKSTPSAKYGKHWGWGDKITAEFGKYSFDCYIETISVTWDARGEKIGASILAGAEL